MTSLFEYRAIYDEKLCKDGKVKVFEDLDTCGKFYFFFFATTYFEIKLLERRSRILCYLYKA